MVISVPAQSEMSFIGLSMKFHGKAMCLCDAGTDAQKLDIIYLIMNYYHYQRRYEGLFRSSGILIMSNLPRCGMCLWPTGFEPWLVELLGMGSFVQGIYASSFSVGTS
jgi:hypothetical protein